MFSRGESDATASSHRAYVLLESELAGAEEPAPSSSSPSPTAELRRSTAEALLAWIRSSTGANGLVVDDSGQVVTSDTAEKRRLWAEHSPRLLQLLKSIEMYPSSDPEVCPLPPDVRYHPEVEVVTPRPPFPSPRVASNVCDPLCSISLSAGTSLCF